MAVILRKLCAAFAGRGRIRMQFERRYEHIQRLKNEPEKLSLKSLIGSLVSSNFLCIFFALTFFDALDASRRL